MGDDVRNPSHYDGATVDAMTAMASCLNATTSPRTSDGATVTPAAHYWHGCAMKYLWRWVRKNGLQDLLKARQCIDYLVCEVYGPDALPD